MPRFRDVLIILILVALPAFAQNFKCFILTPPEQILSGVKRLAIADFVVTPSFKLNDQRSARIRLIDAAASKDRFTGAAARLSDMMTAALLDKERGVKEVSSGLLGSNKKEGLTFQEGAFTNVFTLVERSQLQQVMNELVLAQSGVLSDAEAAQAGKILGVDAIITGSVNIASEETWLQEERKEGEKKTQVECKHLSTNVSATLRLIHVETGQVIGSKDSRRLHDQKECKGATLTDPAKGSGGVWGRVTRSLADRKEASSPEAAVELCLTEIVPELVDYFAPSFTEQKLEFVGIEDEQFRRMTEAAKDALKNPSRGNLHTAFVQYTAIAQQDPYNHGAQFNQGVLCEAIGSYKIAKEKYDLAFSLKSDEDKYRKAKDRLAKQVEFWDALGEMGLELQPIDFVVTPEELAAANRERIKTNGSTKDRHEIKAESNGASTTIAQVPGGIELTVLESIAGWYKVRLPLDGKEGFLAQEKAKVMK